MEKVLLDSDTVSYYLKNYRPVQLRVEEYLNAGVPLYISSVTYFEIMKGLYVKDAAGQMDRFKSLLETNSIVPLTEKPAKEAARLIADLRSKGIALLQNDALIAATALVEDLTLVTNNTRDFSRIPGLRLENWLG